MYLYLINSVYYLNYKTMSIFIILLCCIWLYNAILCSIVLLSMILYKKNQNKNLQMHLILLIIYIFFFFFFVNLNIYSGDDHLTLNFNVKIDTLSQMHRLHNNYELMFFLKKKIYLYNFKNIMAHVNGVFNSSQ